MFSELVLLGIICILTELKNNQFFKRRKNEKISFDRNGSNLIPVS